MTPQEAAQPIQVGDEFEAVSAAPGYQPMRCTVVSGPDDGWCRVTYPHAPDLMADLRRSLGLEPRYEAQPRTVCSDCGDTWDADFPHGHGEPVSARPEAAQPAHDPPATVTLRHCDECGRAAYTSGRLPDSHMRGDDWHKPCPATPREVTYELRAEPRTREEMIEAAAKITHEAWCDNCGSCKGVCDDDRAQAEAVLIAAGVIEAEPAAMTGYLVAQVGDVVCVEQPGPLFGTFGEVIAERGDPAPSVTARVCTVRSDGGAVVEIHADKLSVLVSNPEPRP